MNITKLKNNPKMPKHIAFIIDGNGRWASQRNLPRKEGHIKGFDNLKNLYEIVKETGIKYVSIYAFSVDNWNRPKEEVDGLMKLFKKGIREFKDKKFADARIRFVGDMTKFDKTIQVEASTAVHMAKSQIFPACLSYLDKIANTYHLLSNGKFSSFYLRKEIDEINDLVKQMKDSMDKLEQKIKNPPKKGEQYEKNVIYNNHRKHIALPFHAFILQQGQKAG